VGAHLSMLIMQLVVLNWQWSWPLTSLYAVVVPRRTTTTTVCAPSSSPLPGMQQASDRVLLCIWISRLQTLHIVLYSPRLLHLGWVCGKQRCNATELPVSTNACRAAGSLKRTDPEASEEVIL
jgi:hypothetical protein